MGHDVVVESDSRGAATSTLVAALLPVFVVAIGLAVDGGAHALAQRQAHGHAAAAARAGSDARARASAAGIDNWEAATATAREHLRANGLTGRVWIGSGEIHVEVTDRVDTTFLPLIGVDTLEVTGRSSARPVAG